MSDFRVSYNAKGAVFNPNIPGRVIKPAVDIALREGLELLRDFTPIDTGTAAAGWYRSGPTITNDVPYVIYLDRGTRYMEPRRMLARATPVINRRIIQAIEDRLRGLS